MRKKFSWFLESFISEVYCIWGVWRWGHCQDLRDSSFVDLHSFGICSTFAHFHFFCLQIQSPVMPFKVILCVFSFLESEICPCNNLSHPALVPLTSDRSSRHLPKFPMRVSRFSFFFVFLSTSLPWTHYIKIPTWSWVDWTSSFDYQ